MSDWSVLESRELKRSTPPCSFLETHALEGSCGSSKGMKRTERVVMEEEKEEEKRRKRRKRRRRRKRSDKIE